MDGSSSSSSDSSSSDSEEDESAPCLRRTKRTPPDHLNGSRHYAERSQRYERDTGRPRHHASRSSLERYSERDHQNKYSRHDDYDRRSDDREFARSSRDREYSRPSHGREDYRSEPVAHTSTRRIASKISVPSNYRSQVQEGL